MVRFLFSAFFALLFIGVGNTCAQKKEKSKKFRVWVKTHAQGTIRGFVQSVDEESFGVRRHISEKSKTTTVAFDAVKKVKFRRKGGVAKGFGFGLAIGAASVLVLEAGNDSDSPSQAAVFIPALALSAGFISGTIRDKYKAFESEAWIKVLKNALDKNKLNVNPKAKLNHD